jgi:hypothetical protein
MSNELWKSRRTGFPQVIEGYANYVRALCTVQRALL